MVYLTLPYSRATSHSNTLTKRLFPGGWTTSSQATPCDSHLKCPRENGLVGRRVSEELRDFESEPFIRTSGRTLAPYLPHLDYNGHRRRMSPKGHMVFLPD
jgi:hypothetical protein